MKKVVLKNTTLANTHFDRIHVFLDANHNIVFLPTLWSVHLSQTGSTFSWRRHRSYYATTFGHSKAAKEVYDELKQVDLTDSTIENYLCHFQRFLEYLNVISKDQPRDLVHHTHLVNSDLISQYLNTILPRHCSSPSSLKSHRAAILSYYAFLNSIDLKEPIFAQIYKKTIRDLAHRTVPRKTARYIDKNVQSELLHSCNSWRDRIILRLGLEVGLRASEVSAIQCGNSNTETSASLLNLFKSIEKQRNAFFYPYTLPGQFTKRGRSRLLFFSRDLLVCMKYYYENERPIYAGSEANEPLLLRHDPSGFGKPISKRHPSNIFRSISKSINATAYSFHDCRHTFATTLYYDLTRNPERKETISENHALLEVSKRLGHSSPESSKIYVQMCQELELREGIQR